MAQAKSYAYKNYSKPKTSKVIGDMADAIVAGGGIGATIIHAGSHVAAGTVIGTGCTLACAPVIFWGGVFVGGAILVCKLFDD
ncbi:hypothetical protein [Nostoc sp.]|uniref:hypothetical protein n=1 Tax=Nostoc sp. TaxID=1180 RepID=UPI002FF58B52